MSIDEPHGQGAQSPVVFAARVGLHDLEVRQDILHIHFIGNLDLAQMKELISVYEQCVEKHGYLLMLMDVEKSTGFDVNARRYSADWAKTCPTVQSCAVYGASAALRGFLTILNRATQLLTRGKQPTLEFFASAAEGYMWLETQRPRMKQAALERAEQRKAQVVSPMTSTSQDAIKSLR